mmetsp:Transcript_10806/g.17078  ORF Transcript_10806/g.17078 Transcript_10806/m.17078 type:complete len:318 (-) Transcript_10806:1335-2288(-)
MTQVPFRDALHLAGHRGAEHGCQTMARDGLPKPFQILPFLSIGFRLVLALELSAHGIQNLLDLGSESQIDHAIRLVEHDVRTLVQHHVGHFDAVIDTTGGTHHDVDPVAQLGSLLRDALSSHHGQAHDVLLRTKKLPKFDVNLQCQFAGGCHDERQRSLLGNRVQYRLGEAQHVMTQRNTKRGSLTGPGLGNTNQIPPLHPNRNRLPLNGTGLSILQLILNGIQQRMVNGSHSHWHLAKRSQWRRGLPALHDNVVILAVNSPIARGHFVEGFVHHGVDGGDAVVVGTHFLPAEFNAGVERLRGMLVLLTTMVGVGAS